MGSRITGDHDVAVEISERVLTAEAAKRIVGVHTFPGGAVRVASVRVEGAGAGRVVVVAAISHGKVTDLDGSLRYGLRLVVRAEVPVRVEVGGDGAVVTLDTAATDVRDVVWDPASRRSLAEQLGGDARWTAFELLFPSLLQRGLRGIAAPTIAVPTTVQVPGGPALTLRAAELVTEPRSGASPSLVAVLGTLLPGHTGAATRRSRAALGTAHDVALTLAPEALRDGVLCPALAAYFGTTAEGLCPACGTGTVSLKEKWGIDFLDRLTLDRIDVTFEDGRVRLDCHVSGEHDIGDVTGHLTLLVTFALVQTPEGAVLRPSLQLLRPTIDIDTSDVLDVFSLFATQAAADAVANFLEVLAMAEFQKRTAALKLDVVLPAIPGLPVSWDAVVIGVDGGTLFGRVALAAAPDASVTVDLHATATSTRTATGSGVGGATCARSGYGYTDHDAAVVATVRLVASGLAGPVTARWSVSGAPVPAEGGALTLRAANTGRGVDANDDEVVVVTGLDSASGTLTLRNRAADGNYALLVQCVVEDAVDRYPVHVPVSVDGQPRVWDTDLMRDRLQCARKLVPNERRFPWPASDGPEWNGGFDRVPGGRPGVGGIPGIPGAPGGGPEAGGFVRVGDRVTLPALAQLVERRFAGADYEAVLGTAVDRPVRVVVSRDLATADTARVLRDIVAGARKVRGVFEGVFRRDR